ncbi:hypothetical protein Trydic_g20531 [Trypoxylus dichotomus]
MLYEPHFHLPGHVNRRTNRFIGFARPDEVQEVPLHSAKVICHSKTKLPPQFVDFFRDLFKQKSFHDLLTSLILHIR